MGFADPDAQIGFGFVMNQMQAAMLGSMAAFAMIHAVYESL